MRLSRMWLFILLIIGLLPAKQVCGNQQSVEHVDVWLRNEAGDKITPEDNASDPYSPKKTCGACHSYSTIMKGEHFQSRPKGQKGKISAAAFPAAISRDVGNNFRVNGKTEADCLICHMPGYRLNQRNRQIRGRQHLWAATAGAALGDIGTEVRSFWKGGTGNPFPRPVVIYHWKSKRFTPEGKLSGKVIRPSVVSANCLQCHESTQAFNTGAIHAADHDVHYGAGMHCTDCHGLAAGGAGGRLNHRIGRGGPGKGPEATGMKTCAGCHLEGVYRPARPELPEAAPNPLSVHAAKFPKASFHFSLLSCTACHVQGQPAKGAYLLDVSTGDAFWYTADKREAASAMNAFRKAAQTPWKPWMAILPLKDNTGERYVPIVPHTVQWFAEKTDRGFLRPLPTSVVSRAYRHCRTITAVEVVDTDGKKIRRATVATEADMEQMLKALRRLGYDKAVFLADKFYEWKDGKIVSSALPVANTLAFPVWHNVTAIDRNQTYGTKGCKDCHDDEAPFFGKMKVRNIGRFLKEDYPELKGPNATPQMMDWGLAEVPAYE